MPAPFDSSGNDQPADVSSKAYYARKFLRLELLSGPRLASELVNKARAYGIKESTLTLARKQMGVKSQRWDGVWHWLPPKA
jgi:hypothetical protein